MKVQTRIKLEVGAYNKPFHYCVIGEANEYYLWHKDPGKKGQSSDIFKGQEAFKHYNRMRELLQQNGDKPGFIAYLTDLFNEIIGLPKST